MARAAGTTSVPVGGVDEVTAALEPAIGRPVVLVTDRLAGEAVVVAVRAVRADVVVVDTGPVRDGVAGPAVIALGNSKATARTVAELLLPL